MPKKILALTLALVALMALSIDSYQSRNTFESLTGVNSNTVGVFFLIVMLFYRARSWPIPPIIKQLNIWVVLPISLFITLIFSYIDYGSTLNYSYSLVPIKYQQLGIVALLSASLALITAQINWRSLRGKMIIFLIPIALFLHFSVMDTWPFNFFIEFNKEDHFIEYVQVVVLVIAALTSFQVFRQLSSRGEKILKYIFLVGFIGLMVVAFEEISWGQRLLGIDTPETIAEINVQDEITLHNLEVVSEIIWQTYFVLSLIASKAWLLKGQLRKLGQRASLYSRLLIPPWYTTTYFFIPFIFYYLTRPGQDHTIGRWAESFELFLYLGIAIFIWQSWLWLKSTNQKSSTI